MKRELLSSRTRQPEEGSALVMAVFVLALLTGMGTALLFLSQNEMKMGRANLQTKQAFYLAEAGLEAGRLGLFQANGGGSFDDDLAAAAGGQPTLAFDVDTVQPVYDANGNFTGLTGYGGDVPLAGPTAFGTANGVEGWYAAFLTNDPLEMNSIADSDDRVMLNGVGVGPGGAMEIVQAIVEFENLIPLAPPATITLLGPNPSFQGGMSGAKEYTGDDCKGTGVPGLNLPTVGTIGSEAKADVVAGLGKAGTYNSGGKTGAATIGDLTDPTQTGSRPVDPTWTDCMALRETVRSLRDRADVICTNSGSCVLPPPSPTRIVYAEQNYNADDGEGILVATKQLNVRGNWNWRGMVLVVGTGAMRRAGGGNGTISGAIVIANIAGPDNLVLTDDDCTEGPDGFGSSLFQTSGGGNSVVTYCQSVLDASNPPQPYKIVEFLQH